jgi:hypothetical protein
VIIENKKKEMNWKKNVNLGREGNKVENTMNKMNMNKTQGWTKKKDEKLEEEYEHGGWGVGNKEKKMKTKKRKQEHP